MGKPVTTWEGRRALTDNPAAGPAAYRNAGRALLELDQLAEAAVLCGRGQDDESLSRITDRAVEEGNFFLFKEAAARLPDGVSPRRVRDLQEAAE
jgi:hypothetical protein